MDLIKLLAFLSSILLAIAFTVLTLTTSSEIAARVAPRKRSKYTATVFAFWYIVSYAVKSLGY